MIPDPELSFEEEERLDDTLILMSLVIARGLLRKRAPWDMELIVAVRKRLDKLIKEYRDAGRQ